MEATKPASDQQSRLAEDSEMMAVGHVSILRLQTVFLLGFGILAVMGDVLTSEAPGGGPHFTSCLSREQETFRCWWSTGSFRNLSEPGALRVFFLKENSISRNWTECPDYTYNVANECFFNKSYTSIWTSYCVQLRSRAQNVTYDERCFNVEDIVHPDPPVGLNWTLLNVSRSGLHFDIMVRWEPPPSADVKTGWMTLVYEVQYRERNSSRWNMLDLEIGTQQSIFGLHTNKEYEVRVRCKMRTFENFGDFSESIFVHVAQIPSKESTFPVTVVFIFGAVAVAILLILIIFSQQQRLMVILLPPVPAPKIKGIDPELLKKGKLDELSSVLSNHPIYKPEMYHEDPWVEFIELDMDGVEAGEKMGCSDTQRLLAVGAQLGSSHGLGMKDDDSGRASCYEPELPEADPPCPGQCEKEATSPNPQANFIATDAGVLPPDPASEPDPAPHPTHKAESKPLVQTQLRTHSWVNMDFYAQVSDVTPTGGVVLSPSQQIRVPEKIPDEKKEEGESQLPEKENVMEQQKKEENNKRFHLLIVAPDEGAYTSEVEARKMSSGYPRGKSCEDLARQTTQPSAKKSTQEVVPQLGSPTGEYQSPYLLPPPTPVPPVSDYTVVQDVDAQHSLLLNPTASTVAPPPRSPPTKPSAAVAVGYLTPDLLRNLSL
ncbi:growth hormone receptor isoform X1 [Arapaima gigas]